MEWLKPRRRVASQRCLFLAALALATAAALPLNANAEVSVGVSVGIAPPPLPIYVQPAIPAAGYIWVPGYWAWDGDGYYWVPGTWVYPPYVGALWTPGYWGWGGGVYVFHRGYWGPHVGFYGGINYGYGYTGVGYAGGYWRGRAFYYNRSVNHIDNVHITNVYSRAVVNSNVNRASFNGGHGGIAARPSPRELGYAREAHVAPVAAQEQQRTFASQNQGMRASFNHGAPAVAATPRAGAFNAASAAAHPATGQDARAAAPTPASNNAMALHSAGFAPHGNRSTTAAGGAPVYHPSAAATNHATYTRGPSNPAAGYHAGSRPQPTYQAHASPMPAYHPQAARPVAAPHAQSHAPAGAPHGGAEHR
jgi:hypothetical protein